MIDAVLTFWFREIDEKNWFSADPQIDRLIRERFLGVIQAAAEGELYPWRSAPEGRGRLAEIIVLDQFSRNVYRDTPQAFAQDSMALVLAQEAVAAGVLPLLTPAQRNFLLLPYMHSESRQIHAVAESLYKEFVLDSYRFERQHKAIVDRFGRYPHRNDILGRTSSPEELEFLRQSGPGI